MNNETKINEEDLFKLSAPVGRGQENNPLDVAKVESLMGATGHLDIEKTDGPTGYFGERLEGAVKEFQKEKSLKVDGLIKPEGETASHHSFAFERIDSGDANAKERNYKIGKSDIAIQLDDEMRKWSDEKIIKYLVNSESLEEDLGEVEKFSKKFMKAISRKNISLPRVLPIGGIRGEHEINTDFHADNTVK